jgi:adenylate cyclase
MFRGKIVLIGPTSPILHDVYRTSFARSGGMPGVEIHATILENYLGGTALREMPRWSGVLLTGLAAIASTILVARTGALSALLVTAALCMATVGGAMLALSFRHAWLRGVAPVLAGFVLGLFVSLMAQSIWEERSR